jgi:hypothetical protein
MGEADLFDVLPLWWTFVGMVAIVLLSVYVGFSFARLRRKALPREEDTSVNTIVGATVGLLAFILAFTFGLTASRFEARKELLLAEINAIETTFLRTGLIPEPHRSAVRALLREYVDIRVELVRRPEDLAQAVRESQRLQGLMWPHAAALAKADLRNPDIVSLFVDSLNEMFDMQTKRVTVGIFYRIPWVIRMALFGLTILTMLGVGYLLGVSGKANWLLVLVFSLAFSGLITLIADLDRGGAGRPGLIKITPQPMIDLQQRIAGQMSEG